MPRARLSVPPVKNDTVMGTMGNTQGVIRAANPKKKASTPKPHRLPEPPAVAAVAGATVTVAAGATVAA